MNITVCLSFFLSVCVCVIVSRCLFVYFCSQTKGLHFKHTDNFNFWLNTLADIGLPKVGTCSYLYQLKHHMTSLLSRFSIQSQLTCTIVKTCLGSFIAYMPSGTVTLQLYFSIMRHRVAVDRDNYSHLLWNMTHTLYWQLALSITFASMVGSHWPVALYHFVALCTWSIILVRQAFSVLDGQSLFCKTL